MQCLFCGKELALLKRLRGGGEFCSEAHRKEYQEQYEQLALARLLQAKPPAEPPSPGGVPLGRPSAEPTNAPDPRLGASYQRESSYERESHYEEAQAPAWPEPQPDYEMDSPTPVATMEAAASEESDPAPLAGFLTDPVVPAVTQFDQAGLLELDSEWESVTILPGSAASPKCKRGTRSSRCLPPAPRVELTLSLQALEHHTRTSERGLELREFTPSAPVMELQMRPETGSEPAGADDVMEIFMLPHPPQNAKPWLGLPRGFPTVPAELGDLARLDFATTGFVYSDGPVAVQQAAVLAPELPQAPPQVFTETLPQAPVYAEPAQEAFIAPVEPMAPAEPLATEPPTPELVTKVLPVTLHGLAAARGKLTQAFPSAIATPSDVQIPPSATLPLRPVIVFGPAPAPARAPEAAVSPAESQQVRVRQPQPLPPQSLSSQPQPVQPTPAQPKPGERRSSVVPAPKPVPVRRQAATEIPVPEKVQERAQDCQRFRLRSERSAPKVSAAAASDTAIPSLHLETNQSAWSKLSTGLKIGVAAGLVVAVFRGSPSW